jgi:hypothetical protein
MNSSNGQPDYESESDVQVFDCCGEVKPGECPDLRVIGARYELGYEDPLFQGSPCPWHLVIKCRRGHIAPSGGNLLWASPSRKIKPHPDQLPWIHPEYVAGKVMADGAFHFHVDDLPMVARYLKAIRRK